MNKHYVVIGILVVVLSISSIYLLVNDFSIGLVVILSAISTSLALGGIE